MWAAQGVVDPTSTLTQLGTAGVVCIVLFLWNRELAKRLAAKEIVLDQLNPTLVRVLDVLEASNTAHANSATAQLAGAEALRGVPSQETFTRILVALERVERNQSKEGR